MVCRRPSCPCTRGHNSRGYLSTSLRALPPTSARHPSGNSCYPGGEPTHTAEQVRFNPPQTARSASREWTGSGVEACHSWFSACARVDSTSLCAIDVVGVMYGWTLRGRLLKMSRTCSSFVFHIFETNSFEIQIFVCKILQGIQRKTRSRNLKLSRRVTCMKETDQWDRGSVPLVSFCRTLGCFRLLDQMVPAH